MLNGPGSGLYFTHTGSLLLSMRDVLDPHSSWPARQDLCFNYELLKDIISAQKFFWVLPVMRVWPVLLFLASYVLSCL